MDFKLDHGLMLYLPLHGMNGGPFMSADKYGHLCTVSGAVWSLRGRSFDGVDDAITVPSISGLSTKQTVLMWLCPTQFTVDMNKYVFDENASTHNVYAVQLYDLDDHDGLPTVAFNSQFGATPLTLPKTDTFYHLACTWNGDGTGAIRLNAASTSLISGGTNPTPSNILIGGQSGYCFQGIIGEMFIYDRVLTPAEIQRNYLATKWRYQ